MLNKQKKVDCNGELFYSSFNGCGFPVDNHGIVRVVDNSKWTQEEKILSAGEKIIYDKILNLANGDKKQMLNSKFKFPPEYYEITKDFWSLLYPFRKKRISSIGFKIFYEHFLYAEKINENFLNDFFKTKYKVIHHTRKNLFLLSLSSQRAYKTKKYRITNREDDDLTPIFFNLNQYYTKKKFVEENFIFFQNYLKASSIPFIETSYEGLTNSPEKELEKILSFLEIDLELKDIHINTNMKKQNIYPLDKQIINFGQLKNVLKEDQYFIEALEKTEKEV